MIRTSIHFRSTRTRSNAALTANTKLILPVHLGGSAADLDTILDVGRRRGVTVVEDACQAHLAEWRGRKVGTYGKTGCFSFQASKNLNSGEGGAVLTDDDELVETLLSIPQQQSRPPKYRRRLLVSESRRESAPDRIPGGAADRADDPTARAGAHARCKRRAPHGSLAPDSRHYSRAHVRRLQSQCVSSLYVPLRREPFRRASTRGIHQGAGGRGNSRARRLLAAQQAAVSGRRVFLSWLPGDLLEGADGHMARTESVSGERSACATRLSGSCRRCCSGRGRTWRTSRRQ